MALPPDRLARLAQRIDELMALPADAQQDWLRQLPPEDADLQDALQAFLREGATEPDAEGRALSTGERSPSGPGDTLWRLSPDMARRALERSLASAAEPQAGEVVGPWRLLTPLGRGGMGVVWRAERCDGAFHREVALKLPLSGPSPARLAERFARERDILAALAHPHIARLYDAGVGSRGRPYLALELVDGEPITAYADAQRLDIRARIGLMLQVLAAVHHAHSHLVVHRDLKPSNILVSSDGQVHLLDFGIAQLLDRDTLMVPLDAQLTQAGSSALTPTYASPEQVEHKPVSTVSDVYSLGVVLYELLAGASPYRTTRASRAALEEAVLSGDIRAPSAAVSDAAAAARSSTAPSLVRALRGDLDTIVLKALRRAAADRYASADAFAQDLQRQLRGEAVWAHPDSAAYRAAKFVRRHRVAVAAAAVATAGLVAGAGVALWQATEAREQARLAQDEAAHARREAARAEAAQGFVVDLFEAADPARAQGREPSVRELMARAEEILPARAASQPELASALRGVLVDIYLKLDDEKHALPVAEARVADLRKRGAAPAELGAALFQLGLARAGAGQHPQAIEAYLEADPLLASPAGAAPADHWLDLQARVAHSLSFARRLPEARQRMELALPALAARHGAGHWAVLDHQASYVNILVRLGDEREAARQVALIETRLAAVDPAHALDAAHVMEQLAYGLWQGGQWAASERLFVRAEGELDRLVGPRNTASIESLKSHAALLDTLGRVREADAALERAVSLSHSLYGDLDQQTAIVEGFRVAPLIKLGRLADAEASARRSTQIAAQAQALQPQARLGIQRRLGLALLARGRTAEASEQLEAALAGEGEKATSSTLIFLAAARLQQGQAEVATQLTERAVALIKPNSAYSRHLLALAQLSSALALGAAGRFEDAQARVATADAALQALFEADALPRTLPQLVRAQLLRDRGQAAAADALDREPRARWQAQGVAWPQRLLLLF
jgi:serine/threonine-protein kinase